jgi:hypothetical protein
VSLTIEQAAAEAVGRWLGKIARPGRHCLRTNLPQLDFQRFFTTLANQIEHDASEFSFCAAGFELDEPTLQTIVGRTDLRFRNVATHLQKAAAWRNSEDTTILAIARGEPEGGNTLQEFEKASSGELAQVLLGWLADPEHDFSNTRLAPELHGRILKLLHEQPPAGIVLSLDAACRFAAAWSSARASADAQVRNDAPLIAMAELGIAWDGELMQTRGDSDERRKESLRENFIRSMQSTQEVLSLGERELERLAQKVAHADAQERPSLEALIIAIKEAQRGPTAVRLRSIRLELFRKLNKTRQATPTPPAEGALDWAEVEKAVIKKLLANDAAHCEELFAAIVAAEADQGKRELNWDFGEGQETLSLTTLRPEAEALITLTDEQNWGGSAHFLRDQPTPALLRQLSAASRLSHFRIAEQVLQDDQTGEVYSLPQLLGAWDSFNLPSLAGDKTLTVLWERWITARSALLPSQEWLFQSPLTFLAGDSVSRQKTKDLLGAASELFGRVAQAREDMLREWRLGAEALFEALLALDTIQMRIMTGRPSTTANRLILLPTHPMQLWRGYTFVTKCLEAPAGVDDKTREAIISSLNRTDLYLPAWFASRLPQNDGANKLLPFAGVIGGLAVFQNLENAVASIDGAEDIVNALERFAAIHPEFCRPLRVTVVNPPDPERLLPALAECLEATKGPERLEIRFVATGRLRTRLADAQRLYLATGGELGDAIDSGQLSLELGTLTGEGPRLDQLVRDLSRTPGHVLVIFDEAELELQRRGVVNTFPMSPFTITRELRRSGPPLSPRLELEPTFTEPLFTGTQRLIIAVDGSQGESLSASVSAGSYVSAIHTALQSESPSALWVIIADRVLPSQVLLQSQPLFKARCQMREVGVYTKDLIWLARRVKTAFRECNLDLRETDLEGLLRDGASLLSGGLLDLVQVRDGRPNQTFVQGLAGTLFVARAWKQQHPEGLLMSVDSPAARSWLGLGESSVRSDLVGLYEQNSKLIIEILEIKTSHDPVASEVIDKAIKQVVTTLNATNHGLNGTDVLAVPRREMLKEVLKQAVDAASFERDATIRQRHQKKWIDWLLKIFGDLSQRPEIVLNGRVVCVHLRDRNPPPTTQRIEPPWTIKIECIGEEQCLALGLGLTTPRRSSEPPSNGGGGVASISPTPPARPPSGNARRSPPESSQATTATESTPAGSITVGIEPTIMLGEKTGGEIISWQPYRNGQPIYNPHTVIVGGSGSGKTEALKAFLLELNRAGIACLVFDFKDDYVQPDFAQKVSATIHLAEDGLPLNPMVPGIDPLTGRCDVNSHVFNVEGTLTKVYGLGDQQANTLRQAFYALYDRAGFPRTPAVLPPNLVVPTFRDIRTELERLEAGSLIGRLSPLFDLNIFSAQGAAIRSLFSGMQIVRFTRLPNEEVKKACAEILLLGCYNEILRLGHTRGIRLALVIDEAHRIANLAAVKLLLREARAYGVAVFLSSQQARDFSDDVYANADTLVGLKLNEIRDAERLGALLAGSQQARDLAEQIRRLRPGQAFIKNNQFQPYVKFQIKQLTDRL